MIKFNKNKKIEKIKCPFISCPIFYYEIHLYFIKIKAKIN